MVFCRTVLIRVLAVKMSTKVDLVKGRIRNKAFLKEVHVFYLWFWRVFECFKNLFWLSAFFQIVGSARCPPGSRQTTADQVIVRGITYRQWQGKFYTVRTVYFMQVGITNMSTVKLKIYLFFNQKSFVLECQVNIFIQNQNTVWKFQFRYYFLIAQLYWLKLIFWQTENRWNFCQLKKISIRSWVISKRVIYVFNSVRRKNTF